MLAPLDLHGVGARAHERHLVVSGVVAPTARHDVGRALRIAGTTGAHCDARVRDRLYGRNVVSGDGARDRASPRGAEGSKPGEERELAGAGLRPREAGTDAA